MQTISDRFIWLLTINSRGAAREVPVMQIDESKKLLLSDTLVPDIFITEHLPALDGLSVKLYIYLLLAARTSRTVTEQDLARRLGTEPENIKTAISELVSRDLVAVKDKGLDILDVKAAEIEKTYRQKTASAPAEAVESQSRHSLREKLMSDIAKTFFQGLMSPSWYGEIDSWFDRYGFEPEVIYALFQECARRNKLDSKAYIGKVAENWSMRGIRSFDELSRYFEAHDQIGRASKKIGRKLRRNMTEYDEEYVARWIEKLGYDFEIIELALRKTSKQANPNLEFIDRILEEWFSHQLRDGESIKAYEAAKAARIGADRKILQAGRAGTDGKTDNVGNFAQRQYAEEYFDNIYEEVGSAPEQPGDGSPASGGPIPEKKEMPGQIGLADLPGTGSPGCAAVGEQAGASEKGAES
jgi:DnaD/phage-associated family protein